MHNRERKNWNSFALGVLVMILPLLALPQKLINLLLIALGFFIALFALARFEPPANLTNLNNDENPPTPTF